MRKQDGLFVLVLAFIVVGLGASLFYQPTPAVNGATPTKTAYRIYDSVGPKGVLLRGVICEFGYRQYTGGGPLHATLVLDYAPRNYASRMTWFHPWCGDPITIPIDKYVYMITDLQYRDGEWYLIVSWEK